MLRVRRTTSLSPLLNRHPILKGIGTIRISAGDFSPYLPYLRGSNCEDIAKDWNSVGRDIQKALNSFPK